MSAKKTTTNPLSERVKTQLGDRLKKLNQQPSAMANGGVDAIIARVTSRMTDKHPHALAVATIKVLAACGSKPTDADKKAK